jgi:hypothetical protein
VEREPFETEEKTILENYTMREERTKAGSHLKCLYNFLAGEKATSHMAYKCQIVRVGKNSSPFWVLDSFTPPLSQDTWTDGVLVNVLLCL